MKGDGVRLGNVLLYFQKTSEYFGMSLQKTYQAFSILMTY